jgi:hypothetical protein
MDRETFKCDHVNSIVKLRQIVNTVGTFVDVDECIDFIADIEEKTFVIISEELSQTIIPILQDIPQVNCVYIFCDNTVSKVKNVIATRLRRLMEP